MPSIKVEPTIPNYPPQGIQAQLDLLYLWNPDVANDLIEQLNKALEEVAADLSAYLTKAEAAATYATQTEVTQLSGAVEEVSNKVDTVDSDLKELGGQTASIQQDVNTLKTEVPNKVSKTGDTMTGALSFELSGPGPVIRVAKNATIESGPPSTAIVLRTGTVTWNFAPDALFPKTDNYADLGFDGRRFQCVYTYLLNNGEDITVPTVGGTITLNEVNFQTPVTADNKGATMAELAGLQTALTAEQLAAVNSGITSAKVASYDAYAGEISTAQSTADKADGAAEVAQQTANLAGQNAAQALSGLTGKVNIAQGADNTGNVLAVDGSGNVVPTAGYATQSWVETQITNSIGSIESALAEV